MKKLAPKKIGYVLLYLFFLLTVQGKAQTMFFADQPELYLPGLVSTPNADVKITFSPDGKMMLWGGIDYLKDRKDTDIWLSRNVNGKWTVPERASFDSDSNDFDPFFSPDGKGVYFFSNRPGGFGGDDIYFAAYHADQGTFSPAVNLGKTINTKGNEWTPITDAKGEYLLFSSNGLGGYGKQDLFSSKILVLGYDKPVNLGAAINGPADDFDVTILPEGHLVFTSCRGKDEKADLYLSFWNKDSFSPAVKLPVQINAKDFWTFGPSLNTKDPGFLYFSSHFQQSPGRTDIYRIGYSLK